MVKTISFSQIGDWATEVTDELLPAIWRGSLESLSRDMTQTRPRGGRVPVKEGNLYRSLLLSTSGMVTVGGTEFAAGPSVNVAGVKIDDIVFIGYQAAHARRQNYGFVGTDSLGRTYNQSGFGFLEAAVANWENIVYGETRALRDKLKI